MEPNNFDNNIQQKFNSREIEPSAQAWDRLDAMLTVAEEKKTTQKLFLVKNRCFVLTIYRNGLRFFSTKPEIRNITTNK